MDLDFVSVHEHANKELGQYPTILTSHLVNNPYIVPCCRNQKILQQCSLSLTQRPSFWGHTWSSCCCTTQEHWYAFRNKKTIQKVHCIPCSCKLIPHCLETILPATGVMKSGISRSRQNKDKINETCTADKTIPFSENTNQLNCYLVNFLFLNT